MESRLESVLALKLMALRQYIASKDRGVLFGAFFAFIPMFPSCFVGVVISLLNLYLLRKSELDRSHTRLVVSSFLTGLTFSTAWVVFFFFFSPGDIIGSAVRAIETSVDKLISIIEAILADRPPSGMLSAGVSYGR